MSDMSHANLLPGRARRSRTPPAAIVRAKPLHESAAERLRDMIVEGRLQVGERLHEANLAAVLRGLAHADSRGDQAARHRRARRSHSRARRACQRLFRRAGAGAFRGDRGRRAQRLGTGRRTHDGAGVREAATPARAHGAPSRGGRAAAVFQAQPGDPSRHRRGGEERDPAGDPRFADQPRAARTLRGARIPSPLDRGDGGARAPDGGSRRPQWGARGRDHARARSRHSAIDGRGAREDVAAARRAPER